MLEKYYPSVRLRIPSGSHSVIYYHHALCAFTLLKQDVYSSLVSTCSQGIQYAYSYSLRGVECLLRSSALRDCRGGVNPPASMIGATPTRGTPFMRGTRFGLTPLRSPAYAPGDGDALCCTLLNAALYSSDLLVFRTHASRSVWVKQLRTTLFSISQAQMKNKNVTHLYKVSAPLTGRRVVTSMMLASIVSSKQCCLYSKPLQGEPRLSLQAP